MRGIFRPIQLGWGRLMSKLIGLVSSSAVIATFLVGGLGSVTSAAAAGCTPTGFFRDGLNMTAAQIGGDVTGSLDATGCNVGVYYDNPRQAT